MFNDVIIRSKCYDENIENNVYVTTSKLISAEYHKNVSFLSEAKWWVLKFENGMVIKIEIGLFQTSPVQKMYHIGSNYKIYR